ncbi:MAG: TatD family hydrolase [Gammaproteobacteria bacterium]|nr:TatD family hydrolase [Gammaproteobacteria bacterium]
MRALQGLLSHPKVVAMGEIGLDFALPGLNGAGRAAQLQLLEAQLQLAVQCELPVIIHLRKAHQPLLQLLSCYPGVRGVIHAFSGSRELAKAYLKQGFLLGIGTVLLQPQSRLRAYLAELPLSSLLLESDAPDMAPERGARNTPAVVAEVAAVMALLYNLPVAEIAAITQKNCEALFQP